MKLLSKIKEIDVEKLIPYVNNPKEHPENQIDKIASSIKNFGFTVPIIVDGANEVIAGHGRLMAAKKLGLTKVPCIVRDDLTESQVRAFRIADNKVAESEWNIELLTVELEGFELGEMPFTGFDKEEIENLITFPDFQPVSEEEQPRLDQKKKVVCPNCGEEFTPS